MLTGDRQVLCCGPAADHHHREAIGERPLPAVDLAKHPPTRPAARRHEHEHHRPAPGAERLERARLAFQLGEGEAGRLGADRQSWRQSGELGPCGSEVAPEIAPVRPQAAGRAPPARSRRRRPRPRPARPGYGPRPSRVSTGLGPPRRRSPRGPRARRCERACRDPPGPSGPGRSSGSRGPPRVRARCAIPPMKARSSAIAATAPQRAEAGGIRATAVASSTSGSSSAATGSVRLGTPKSESERRVPGWSRSLAVPATANTAASTTLMPSRNEPTTAMLPIASSVAELARGRLGL